MDESTLKEILSLFRIVLTNHSIIMTAQAVMIDTYPNIPTGDDMKSLLNKHARITMNATDVLTKLIGD